MRLQTSVHAVDVQASWCIVQVMLSFGSYPEVGAHTMEEVGEIVADEAER